MRQFNNTWIDPDHIVSVVIDYEKEFSATGLAVEVATEKPRMVTVVLDNAVALNLEKGDAQEFRDWWVSEWNNL